MALREEIEIADRKGRELQAALPHAVSARYDRRIGRVVLSLSTGLDVAFSPRDAEGLANATPAELNAIEISPSGFGIHFPKLDADIYLPALLEGLLGSRKWMASRLGAQGGRSKSVAKTAAAKRNGRRGGRPRKHAAAA
ncbi:MAG: DUF2442 domain-containing protein [Bryobacteraceae bacterium]